jgi:putative oxygen-independent coproporphyrinogen III oxidase
MRGGFEEGAGKSAGLYVHVPFCRSKCPYCDFYSVPLIDTVPAWIEALHAEARMYVGDYHSFGTIYVGGGTPSLLSGGDMERLVRGLEETLSFEEGFEFTIEANPDDVTPRLLDAYRALGAKRLSVGVQSFDDGGLRLLGRRHDAARAEEAIRLARRAGFRNIGIDLIYALPGQTGESWRATLERALFFKPEHLSCYELTLEPGAPLSGMIDEGTAVGEEMRRDLFVMTSEFLEKSGYEQYEVSNFAREPEFRSRHNSLYWDHSPYLGLGPSAHSFRGGVRWWNVRSIDGYCDMASAGKRPVEGSESLTGGQLLLERLYFGFRTRRGLPMEFFDALPGGSEILSELERTSMLRIVNGRAVPTRRGYLLSDRLPLLFSCEERPPV